MTQFERLGDLFFRLLARAALPTQPLAISCIISDLRPRLKAACSEVEGCGTAISAKNAPGGKVDAPVGLNTVGLLVDRLSILSIGSFKRGCAAPEGNPSIVEIIRALDVVQSGLSSVNTKQTSLTARTSPKSTLQAALWLLATNIELWEAQEVLYSRGPESLPDTELRSYIVFFAHENVRRNELMQQLTARYWTD